jgi:hypothetical protein
LLQQGPDPQPDVVACCDCHIRDQGESAEEFVDIGQSHNAPDSSRIIEARSNDALAIRGPRGAKDRATVAFQLREQLPRGRGPDACRRIRARGDDALPVREPRSAKDRSSFASNCSAAAFQTRAFLSSLAVTMSCPSWDHAAL